VDLYSATSSDMVRRYQKRFQCYSEAIPVRANRDGSVEIFANETNGSGAEKVRRP